MTNAAILRDEKHREASSLVSKALDEANCILSSPSLPIIGTLKARYLKEGMTIHDPINKDEEASIFVTDISFMSGESEKTDQILFSCERGHASVYAEETLMLAPDKVV
ncbi:hypothetical protein AB4455_22960 [Vibrio sp. 10N.261.46.E12]|uniref:hypothetical protein n=1 Tax=unclassified Vibrio TaxID=2614977 RepID=UPI0009776398|nr:MULTISPECIES: hypothetical protein [unclassified Vibrio]OMO38433.1 hypothetical protein BH584_17685 [Vibrio sp. 10N.261.45.E1]PMJ36219.1 hypothetical protein BCU27_23545 [Vibrio sp. 10N.286.45.B6]PML84175.1 hypothetical protein BCT66_17880 [Vibrio sp. 10N.261.49.E11]PMM89290.1 hypothetical protein BCT46_25165 [Vibrio sp. 10N.261.46.E8]PMN44177.1 hypothetical protein BCT32_15680 [Vibrio sp. 10N.261.45.E11]